MMRNQKKDMNLVGPYQNTDHNQSTLKKETRQVLSSNRIPNHSDAIIFL